VSTRRENPSGVGLRLLAGGALLAVALVTVLVRAQVTAERYALRDCAARKAEALRRVAAGRYALTHRIQGLATAGPVNEAQLEGLD